MKLCLSLIFLLHCWISPTYAQVFQLVEGSPVMSIVGSSTLHDWTVEAKQIEDYPAEVKLADLDLTIEEFSFRVAVESMDGGRGPAMNGKIKKALLAEQQPYVNYQMKDPVSVTLVEGVEVPFTAVGDLGIAGVSQTLDIEGGALLEDDKITFSGSKLMKMTDFGIEPPSAMFGQIKTGDDITVHFSFTYLKSE